MKKNLLLALSIVLVIVSVSCNKADKTGLLVPKDAAVVVHLNLESLSSKLSWDEIKSTTWFREMEKEDQSSDTLHKQLLQDPSMSGIDSKSNIIFFMKRVGKGGYFSVVGGLKDAAKFEAMVKKGGKEDAEITKDGDLTVATMKKDHGAVMIWNNATFIVVSNAPIGSMIGRPSNMMNHNEMEAGGLNFSTDSLRLFAKQILNLKGDDLLDNDERFSSLVKESGDLHFWVNSEKLTGNSLAGMVQMMKFDVLFEKNITTGTLNFDNGKISVKSKQYFGDEMTKLLKNNPPKNVGSDVINRLPNDNVFVAGVFNYPPQGLKELLKLTGADGMANGFFGEMNYSVDEFIKANKGDIAFALTDFTMKRDSIPTENLDGTTNFYFRSKPTFNYVAGVSVNDKDAFNKLIGIMTKEMGSQLPAIMRRASPASSMEGISPYMPIRSADITVADT